MPFFIIIKNLCCNWGKAFINTQSSTEANPEKYSYMGWTPCIAGQLSFDFISCGLSSESKDTTINVLMGIPVDENRQRIIYLHSQYDWRDRTDDTCDGAFDIFVTASSSDDDHLKGSLYISRTINVDLAWPSIQGPEELLENKYKNFCASSECILTRANKAENLRNHWNELNEHLRNGNSKVFYKIDFVLEKDGLTKLKCDNQSEHDEWLVCRQAFYYLKYSLHEHKHHPASIDSLTTVHRIREDDSHITEILNDLRNGIIEIKREQAKTGFVFGHQANGVATYTKSLLASLKEKDLISHSAHETENCYYSNVIASVSAIEQQDKRKVSIKSNADNVARQLLMFMMGFFGPVLIAYSIKIGSITEKNNTDISWIGETLLNIFSSGFFMSFLLISMFVFYWLVYLIRTKTVWRESTRKETSSYKNKLLLLIQTHLDRLNRDILYGSKNGYHRSIIFLILATLFLFFAVYMAIDLDLVVAAENIDSALTWLKTR